MKFSHLLLVPAVLLATASCKSDRETLRQATVSACLDSARVSGGAAIPEELLKDYCNCSADAVINPATDAEIRALNDKVTTPEEQERIARLTAPCLQTLQQKVAARAAQ